MAKKFKRKKINKIPEIKPIILDDNKNDNPDEPIQEDAAQTPIASLQENDQNKIMNNSRLRRRMEKKSKITLFLTSLGLIALLVLLVMYGQDALIAFTVFIGSAKDKTSVTTQTTDSALVYIAPPVLDNLPEATNSGKLKVSGYESSDVKTKIKLYVNNELADVTDPADNDTFIFKDVPLKEGVNSIKALASANGKNSEYTTTVQISYLKKAPALSLDEPQDGITLTGENSTLTVRGKTDSGCTVTVNDYMAITRNDGSYTYNFRMQNGENKIHVVSKDMAGNKAEKEIKITYSP